MDIGTLNVVQADQRVRKEIPSRGISMSTGKEVRNDYKFKTALPVVQCYWNVRLGGDLRYKVSESR